MSLAAVGPFVGVAILITALAQAATAASRTSSGNVTRRAGHAAAAAVGGIGVVVYANEMATVASAVSAALATVAVVGDHIFAHLSAALQTRSPIWATVDAAVEKTALARNLAANHAMVRATAKLAEPTYAAIVHLRQTFDTLVHAGVAARRPTVAIAVVQTLATNTPVFVTHTGIATAVHRAALCNTLSTWNVTNFAGISAVGIGVAASGQIDRHVDHVTGGEIGHRRVGLKRRDLESAAYADQRHQRDPNRRSHWAKFVTTNTPLSSFIFLTAHV